MLYWGKFSAVGKYFPIGRKERARRHRPSNTKFTTWKEVFEMYLPREEGQGLVEYALILVLVAIVVIAILASLGPQIGNIFSQITSGLTPR